MSIYVKSAPTIVAILLSLLSDKLAFGLVLIGVTTLCLIQISLMKKSGKWAVIGGNPMQKITGERAIAAIIAVGLILGALISLIVKILWLKYV